MKCENWNEDLTDAESVNKDYRDHNVHYRKASEIVSSLHKKLVSKQVLIHCDGVQSNYLKYLIKEIYILT